MKLVSRSTVGNPITGGRYLFWTDNRNPKMAIYGYDLEASQEFLVKELPLGAAGLASDGQTLVWVEGTPRSGDSLHSYNLTTRQESIIISPNGGEFGGLALDNGTLYYQGSSGLVGRNLSTGQEQLISAKGQNPVAADGKLLWTELDQRDCVQGSSKIDESGEEISQTKSRCASIWSLHLQGAGGSSRKVLAGDKEGFTGYSISGDKVTWSEFDGVAHLYTISNGTTEDITTEPASSPFVVDASGTTKIVWTIVPSGKIKAPTTSSIHSQTRGSGKARKAAPIVDKSATRVKAWGIARQQDVIFTADADPSTPEEELYLTGLDQTGLTLADTSMSAQAATTSTGCGSTPVYCGQVNKLYNSKFLYENTYNRWYVHGVQLFLPQYGINSWTFEDGRYNSSIGDINYWLDQASNYLRAQSIRIEIKLPYRDGTTLVTPTSYATILDFLTRANSRGMRVGIVMHNSGSWSMGPDRESWIRGFIDYFNTPRYGLVWNPVIAYVSADNEVNNHCGTRASGDCYDTDAAYVEAANYFVSQFNSIFKSTGSSILTTLGISTELPNVDGFPAANDFFRIRGSAPPLYQSVDFLSPHNYGGGAVGIEQDIRYRDSIAGITSVAVLEEYGFFTDDVRNVASYREGCFDPYNFNEPSLPYCPPEQRHPSDPNNNPPSDPVRSAAYYVEKNARALRGDYNVNYAGGVAFMIADIDGKTCNQGASNNVGDLFSGLFAVGGSYCGGTYSTGVAVPKAPAFRVRTHHCYYPYYTC